MMEQHKQIVNCLDGPVELVGTAWEIVSLGEVSIFRDPSNSSGILQSIHVLYFIVEKSKTTGAMIM